jgi:hypothetical protein
MSRAKRRQRSTQIRKRIEKKQREEDKARKREAKGKEQDADLVLRMIVARDPAEAVLGQIRGLEERLAEGPIRGWTPDDLAGEHGLTMMADMIGTAIDRQTDEKLVVELTVGARGPLLERLSALEMAAPGLRVDWEAGFDAVMQALGKATEELPQEEEPEEGSEGEGDESGDETESGEAEGDAPGDGEGDAPGD